MSDLVTQGGVVSCSFATAVAALNVSSNQTVRHRGLLVATIMDSAPMRNILPMGTCQSPQNPEAATGIPPVCRPITLGPWSPGSPKIRVGGQPALTRQCRCMCQWGGVVQVK
jgi:hypothetical protein